MADIAPVAGNGLLDRRAFLRASGILFTGYVVDPAAAEPLSEAAWSKEPGTVVPAYGTPSKYEKAVVRTLSNPNGEPRNQHARTPHQQLQGIVTPNGLHFTISHAGNAEIDPAQHRLAIHGLVKRPLVFSVAAVLRRIDLGVAGVRDRKVQAVGRDDPLQLLVRGARMLVARLAVRIAERAH